MDFNAKRRRVVTVKLKSLIYSRFISPIFESSGSISQVSWGVGIGVFFALTPTMGVQMYVVALIWAFCRYILKTNFKLAVALAMVWISNPLTMIPLYYLFLVSGYMVLDTRNKLSFELFNNQLSDFSKMESTWQSIVGATKFLIFDLGWPMVIGSLFFAIPGAVIGFWMSKILLSRYRQEILKSEEFPLNGVHAIDQTKK